MPEKICVLAMSYTLVLLTGCSSIIYKEFSLDRNPATSLSVDAKQRVILVTDKGGRKRDARVVCAEPSPDALVATAAAASAQVGRGTESAKVAGSFAETAATVGPRTQTIQLLRDGLYRACEALMNGAIDWREYKQIVTGYDQATITLLAIDGLTQNLTSRPVVIGAKGGAGESEGTTAEPVPPVVVQPGNQQAEAAAKVAPVIKEILESYYNHQILLTQKQIELAEKTKKPE